MSDRAARIIGPLTAVVVIGGGGYVMLRILKCTIVFVAGLFSAATPPPPAPPPPAVPIILRYQLQPLVTLPNSLNVMVRNDGKSGWVMLSYCTFEPVKKREAGATTFLKNAFTDKGSPGYTVEHHLKGAWVFYIWLDAGQTKVLPLELSGHSSWDEQGEPWVRGVDKPPDGAIIK